MDGSMILQAWTTFWKLRSSPQTVNTSWPTRTATRICSGPFAVEVEAPGALSLRSLTGHTPPPPFLPPFFLSIPPTPTLPRTCSRRSSASLPHSSSKVTEATVVGPPTSSNSPSYHPTLRRNRPRLLSFHSSSSQLLNQVSKFKTRLFCSRISGNSITPCFPLTVKSAPRARSRLGCYPRRSLKPTNQKSWPRNY